MSVDFLQLAVPGVRGLSPYQPGKPIDELARELGLKEEDIVKLASNENPMGPSAAVKAAMNEEMAEMTRYPDGAGFALKAELSSRLNVTPAQLTLGNGSSDILDFVVRAFVDNGDEVVVSEHAFSIYSLLTRAKGGVVVEVPALNFGHDLVAMAAAVTDKTRVVFLTNPSNPTGTWNTRAEVLTFMQTVPANVVVVLDEAYCEFVEEAEYPDGVELLAQFPNLIVARTFSKVYGLASLRVGYGVSSPELADIMNRVRPPFNVNSYALVGAVAALRDEAYLQMSVKANRDGMALLTAAFAEMGLDYIPSVGNFVAFRVPDSVTGIEVYQKLLREGVIVRPIANYGMPQYVRVSIGTDAENRTFLKALAKVLA
ncbi:histidinol-phosphate transaminase [Parathalassolituus penaei]|uniref:Histidinol-phosphate aminotransferase n=1 Tax=Parathalassolituus penaei TaxID=2997323 RepID=A0A9X3EK66_9GAMM|nr:histidinol-phosphate transaminase [Parathalassolituus penaei]MCY0965821.1 histidinol-phosphate transaminase [Parathalassolituus penaei]